MNTRKTIDNFTGPFAHHVGFNNDKKYFSVALDNGFAVYTSENCELYLEQELGGGIGESCMLDTSQIFGLLGGGLRPQFESNRLALWDTTKKKEVAAVTARSPIVSVRLTKSHIAVVLETSLNLYKHQPQIEKIGQYGTSANPHGLCCLGSRLLVIPGRSIGQMQLVNLSNLKISIMPAHTSPLRALELSPNEEIVASASDKGTLIRLHSTSTCARIAELRRGVASATIYSLAVSPSNSKLAVTSDTNTLHVFDIPFSTPPRQTQASASDGNWQHVDRPSSQTEVAEQSNIQKWGGLAKLPFAPRVFKDVYSFTSSSFDPGEDDVPSNSSYESRESSVLLGAPVRKPPKGIVGWIDEDSIIVINAGRNARYERFALVEDGTGKIVCIRAGWSRYLVPN